jgi:hypothetical protein
MGEDFWVNLKTTTFFIYLSQKGVLNDPYWLTEVLQKMYTTSLTKMKNSGTLNPPFKRKHEGPKVALIRHSKKKSQDREMDESGYSSSEDSGSVSGKRRRSKRSSPLSRSLNEPISRAGSTDSIVSAGGGRLNVVTSDKNDAETSGGEYSSSPSKKDILVSSVPLLKLPSSSSSGTSGDGESLLPKVETAECSGGAADSRGNPDMSAESSEEKSSRPRSPRNILEQAKLDAQSDREFDSVSKSSDNAAQSEPKETRSPSGKNSPTPRGSLPALKTESLARLTVSTTVNESISKILGTSIEKFLSKDDDTIGQSSMQAKPAPLDRKMRHSITAIDTSAITAAQRLPPLSQVANAGSISPRNNSESPAALSSPLSARRLKRLESYEKVKGGAN